MTFFGGGQTLDQTVAPTPGGVANQNLARRIKMVQDAAPIFGQGEGIKFATQLASSQFDDNELVRQAQVAGGDILVRSYMDHLKGIEDPWKQLQAYKAFDDGQKRLLQKAGYVPPEAEKPSPKGLGIVTDVLGSAASAFGTVTGLKDAWEGITYLSEIPGRLYRMNRLYDEQSGDGLFDFGGMATKADMRDLWNRSAEGEKTFSQKSQDRVRKAIGDADQFAFVMAIAEGKSIHDYLTEDLEIDPNSPLYEQQVSKYSQYQGQEEVEAAVKDLRNNKFSPGRDLASLTGLDRGTTPFNIVSGGVDAAFRIVTDPTLIAGKATKAIRLSRYGLNPRLLSAVEGTSEAAQLARRVDHLMTVPRFANAAEEIAAGIRTGQSARLMDTIPQLRGGGLNSINDYVATKGIAREAVQKEDIFDFYKSTLGTTALREGKFAAPHYPGTILPSLNKPERLKAAVLTEVKDWVGGFRLEDYGFDALTPEQLKELFGLKGKLAIDIRQGVGNAIHSFYTKVPKFDYMGPDDPANLEQFRAVLDYSLPGFLRDDFVEEFMKTSDFATRRSVYESGVEAMFHYSGALATDEGKRLLQKSLRRYQAYANDGLDLIEGRPHGIGEADLAEYWAIPDFRDMLKATAETTRYRHFMDSTNDGLINRFFANYWKPAVLLKAGFIPRAYGEEYLGFILREGPKAWLKSQAAITATKDGYLLPMRPVGWIADSLLSHIPLTYRNSGLDIYAHNFADNTSTFVRNWAGKMAPDEYVAAARALGTYGGGIHGAVSQLGVAYGEVSAPIGTRLRQETIGRLEPGSDAIVQIPVRHGEFTTHVKGSGFHAHSVLREMRRMQSDRLFSPLVDAGRRQIGLDDGERITGQFREAGLLGERGEGLDYVSDLRKLRELVPDEVMPNFENFLKHDSYASARAVQDDLIAAGMDEDTARLFYDNLKNLDTRERIAIFTRDGELEKVFKPYFLDPDAAFDVESQLPVIRQGIEDEARREYNEILEELWSPSTSTNAYWKIARRRLNSADMAETVRKSYRSRMTMDGRQVAKPPAKGTRRVYTVVMDKDPVSAFEDLGNPQLIASNKGIGAGSRPALAETNPLLDAENGYIPFKSAEVNQMIPDHQPNMNIVEAAEGEVLTPEEMAWFTQDFAHADNIRGGLSARYKGQSVSIGYVDVPEDVFQEGQRLAKANASGGLDPLAQANQANQVWVPKTWRENYQVLGDDNYQMINGVPAVGATRNEAIDDWAYVLGRRYQQVFESADPHALRELQHRLIENRINVKDIVDAGPYLADEAIGPAILEPLRENWFKAITTKGFDIVGQGGNAMIRNQMYLHYYTQRLSVETTRMTKLLGQGGVSDTIENYAGRMGVKHYQLASDWSALPDDIRNAVNPVEAMIARDPIPPSLRQVVDVEDQKQFAEAFTAFYEHKNPDLLADAEKLWRDKYVKGMGVEGYSFRDIQDSYISLDEDIRVSIRDNGYPPQMPKSFEAADLDADEWTELRDALNTNRHVYKTAHDMAMRAAINDTIPWIDDHRVRSQFQQHGRNLIPFWFSQENFIKRVANNVYRDPAVLAKAQIGMDALHNSGFVTQNQYGEDVYNIPLTGPLMKTVTKLMDVLPGDWSLPIVNPMTGQLKYTIPGLDTLDRIGPSVSPLAALPLQAVAKAFPELEGAKRAIIGERGVTDSSGFDLMMRSLVPSYAYRIFESVSKDIESDSEYASAMIQTAQMLEANGHGLPESAEPYEYDDYMDRLENFTRMQMFMRGIVGFFSPAAPSTSPVEEFTPEFTAMLKEMPLEEAFMQFMAENPTARAYTIVKTEVPSKAPLSASEEAGVILDNHSAFFDRHKMAAPWLLPQSNDDTGFSNSTYNTQIARELRRRKTLKEWYDDYYFASAATDYFDTKEAHELRMAAAKGNTQLRQQYTEQYRTWKEEYLGQHKVFAKLLVDPDAQVRRREVLDQMSAALDDPEAPDVPHKEALRDLADTYKGYLDRKSQFKRNTSAERLAKQTMTDQFTLWVKSYVEKNPGVRAFYDRIIRPEAGIDD